ncbi:hypothetical protein ES703_125864 [subsurface metagenome]
MGSSISIGSNACSSHVQRMGESASSWSYTMMCPGRTNTIARRNCSTGSAYARLASPITTLYAGDSKNVRISPSCSMLRSCPRPSARMELCAAVWRVHSVWYLSP